ncbi:hypothetical protein MMC18_001249 [Xylographa bjoerkii]|nr:hypothetical protein [Xylographa bjoerkii]
MTVGPPLGFDLPSPSATITATSTPSPSSFSSSSSSTPTSISPITNHYGGSDAPLSSTQTCSTACAIAIPVVLLSLLTLGFVLAYFKHRHPTRTPSPLNSAIAAGSASAKADPAPAGHVPDRVTFAQRMRGFFNKYESPARTGAVRESGGRKSHSTLRQSVRRDPRTKGYVDLEAGHGLGHGRSGSSMSGESEMTLTEALAEGELEDRKLGA